MHIFLLSKAMAQLAAAVVPVLNVQSLVIIRNLDKSDPQSALSADGAQRAC